MAIRGMLSAKAVAIPVIRFVAPGPDVTTQTPGFPLMRAYPLAQWAAFCSVRMRTDLISEFNKLLKNGAIATPG